MSPRIADADHVRADIACSLACWLLPAVRALRPQAANRMTLDSFRELFRERPPKRFGPVWHLWNLVLAVLPAITIAVVCTHIEKTRLKELENTAEEV